VSTHDRFSSPFAVTYMKALMRPSHIEQGGDHDEDTYQDQCRQPDFESQPVPPLIGNRPAANAFTQKDWRARRMTALTRLSQIKQGEHNHEDSHEGQCWQLDPQSQPVRPLIGNRLAATALKVEAGR
jgi:hypothetical protein